jgi:hypothetical protein
MSLVRAFVSQGLANARRHKSLTAGLMLTAVVSFVFGWLPGFGGPGYEIALVLGLLLPTPVALSVALASWADSRPPLDLAVRALWTALLHGCLVVMITAAHGLRSGFCEPWSGLVVVGLGPVCGLFNACLWGVAAAEFARLLPSRRRFAAAVLAAIGPLGSIAVGLYRFYSSPMIFGFDPFVGYFSGTLYDTVLSYDSLLTYRVGTATSLGAFIALLSQLERTESRLGLSFARPLSRGGILLCASFALVSLTLTVKGDSLGHFHTRTTIARELGGLIEGSRCDVVYARALARKDVRRLHAECEAHIVQLEQWWGAPGPEKITVFLFEDAAQKSALMGAAGTNIAKPWLAEVYIQGVGFPHKVLGHELMHVIAGSSGRGPFRVAADLGGALPNPGLIEGVAVAAAPKEDDLSSAEWARAMKEQGLLPPLERLFGLSFLAENSSMAYTVSGAFVAYIHERFGNKAVRAWYAGASLESATGVSWQTLESDWHASLDALEFDAAAAIQAQAKFARAGFFSRRCPRLVDGCRERAEALSKSGDTEGALLELAEARRYEPKNPHLRVEEALVLAQQSPAEAEARFATLIADESLPTYAKDELREELADRLLARAALDEAAALYRDVLARTGEEGKQRTLHVKLRATQEPPLRLAVVELLIGVDGESPDRPSAFFELGRLRANANDDGLLPYLVARYLNEKGRNIEALVLLEEAQRKSIVTPKVRAETLRLSIAAACDVGDVTALAAALRSYRDEPGVRAARLQYNQRFGERCHLMREVSARFVSEVAQ